LPEDTSLQKEYARYRIERAKEDLGAAHLLFDAGNYRIANNRSYYAIFHALRAVLVFDNFDSSKHSGVIAEFRRKYIKEGIFPVEVSKMIGAAFTIRSASDYDDMFVASKLGIFVHGYDFTSLNASPLYTRTGLPRTILLCSRQASFVWRA
jgi:uncharacterized protein (UPF0332 family)